MAALELDGHVALGPAAGPEAVEPTDPTDRVVGRREASERDERQREPQRAAGDDEKAGGAHADERRADQRELVDVDVL